MNTKKEKLLYDTYQSFMDQGFGLTPPDTLHDIVSNKIMGFGTTADEKIFGFDALFKFLKTQNEQSKGLAPNWKIVPVNRYINSNGNLAAFADDIFLTMVVDGEKLEMYLRSSIVLEYTGDKWLVIHWHGSKPENVLSEADTFGVEKWKQKAEALEKVVKERTADLVIKNRDLEIEAALERVRSVAMAMNKAEDLLSICETLYKELQKLGFSELRNSMINIHNDEKESFVNYDFSDFAGAVIATVEYNVYHSVQTLVKQARGSRDAFIEYIYTGKELEDWKEFRKKGGEYDDPRVEKITALYYYFYSIGIGSIGISAFSAIGTDGLELLKRFRNVFDLAYRRYIDITKAAAQAREAQIELALERVRARTMAMQHSTELAETSSILFQQIKELGFETWSCGFCIWKENALTEVWMGADSGGLLPAMYIPYKEEPTHHDVYKAHLKKVNPYDKIWEGNALQKHYAFLKTIPSVKEAIDLLERSGLSLPGRQCYYVGFFKKGYLLLITKDPNAELKELSNRFAKVFDQTYTRFLDLQKAEALARESQIEAALEKVRSRSLAMQKSDELQEVVKAVFERLMSLNIDMNVASIFIFEEGKKDWEQWVASSDTDYTTHFRLPYIDNVIFSDLEAAKQSGKDFYAASYSFEQKYEWFKYAFENTEYSRIPAERKKFLLAGEFYKISFALTKNTGLQIAKYAGENFSENDNDVLRRFSKVFEQAYIRFLDLQKAENQSRENQIQLALERARTQSMIMQHSSELDDTLRVFHEQVLQLGIASAFSFLWLPNEAKDEHLFWAAWAENKSTVFKSKAINYPLDRKEPATAQCLIDWKSNEPVFSYHVPPEGVVNYFAAWSELITGVEELKPENFSDGLYYVEAFMKYGCFGVLVKNELRDEEKKILYRFSIEFEQTYTRFLDLQKAEAQSRESQIQLALERVRARTMAMQKSEELREVIQLVYQQIVLLNIHIEHTGFLMDYKTRDDLHIWLADHHLAPSEVTIPCFDSIPNNRIKEAKEKGKNFFKYHLNFEEKNKFYRELFTFIPGVPEETLQYYLSCPALAGSGVLLENIGLYIENFEGTPYTDEENNTLMRFAKVFQQTYTRFLDLEKAEAQAREAQIELGLERVRARAMAMQNSDELKELISTVFIELTKLDLVLTRCLIMIFEPKTNASTWWMANSEAPTEPIGLNVKNHLLPPYKAYISAWKKKKKNWQYILEGKNKNDWDDFLFVETELSQLPAYVIAGMKAPERVFFSASFNNFGCLSLASLETLSNEHSDILLRFAKVFDLTYTRFNDLQKAEAQAREAQIQLALERVRARTMAMQKSEELGETAYVLFQQFNKLGEVPEQISIGIMKEEEHVMELWATIHGNQANNLFKISLDEPIVMRKLYAAWKEQKKSFVIDISGKDLQQYNDYRNSLSDMNIDDERTQHRRVVHAAFFSKGLISFSGEKTRPPESIHLLERFAAVFEQTYTRFLDLQKAEAQAREAQIEAALEKVRSVALTLKSSEDMLDIAQALYEQLLILGFTEIRNAIIDIHNAGEETFMDYDYSKEMSGTITRMSYYDDPIIEEQVRQIESSSDAFFELILEGKELRDLINVRIKNGEKEDPRLNKTSQLTYNLYSFGNGAIGISNFGLLTEEQKIVLKRFRNVFTFAYKRYTDLAQAEQLARQAQIDLENLIIAKKKTDDALTDLKAAQSQLIQSEKMASLGELTAGIAHEIQNPLNFVNNFSEVNAELIAEMKEEMDKGNMEDAKAIADDIKDNEKKINYHGKRADAIVKGMLQHSRKSEGTKEATDINALCDEYLRLSYHGLRAKDKLFNAILKTDFDERIGKINIIPQDMGRVLLNLITNAFYAVNEKIKMNPGGYQGEKYEPTVTMSTKKINNTIEIKVADNGNGIPSSIKEKIFQPFFTTKPTGQGTGLGLSLAYDIVKAHGGKITVESIDGDGTTFTIQLPTT